MVRARRGPTQSDLAPDARVGDRGVGRSAAGGREREMGGSITAKGRGVDARGEGGRVGGRVVIGVGHERSVAAMRAITEGQGGR